jgi:hypothetical protein
MAGASGGIYDYWGCPIQLRSQARHVLDELRGVRQGIRGYP